MMLHKSTLFSLLVIATTAGDLLPGCQVEARREILFPDSEPSSLQIIKDYRILHAGQELYPLESIGSLEDADIAERFKGHEKWSSPMRTEDFKFNGSDYLKKYLGLQYFIVFSERTALHVYDDPRDKDLAAGPQVNQDLCGLQLDYMYHMAQKHRANVMNSSEYSIFKILDTYDWPRYGLSKGNNFYLGDYRGCLDAKLNVMKHELVQVNRTAAETYFTSSHNEPPDSQHPIVQWIIDNLSPLVGIPKKLRVAAEAMQKHKDKLRAVPMRYCLAGIRWPVWKNTSYETRNIALRAAVCIPETCDSNSLALHGDKVKRLTDLQSSEFYSDYYISHLYCLPDELSEMRNPTYYKSTIIFIVFNGIWIGLTIAALLVDLADFKPSGYLDCWSLKSNWSDLWAGKKSSKELASKTNLEPLEGIKIFAAIMVICGHAHSSSVGTAWNSMEGHEYISESFVGPILAVGPLAVDIFFVLTGVLTNNFLLSKKRNTLLKPAFWFGYILYRYIRIVPLYALIHWFLQSGFRFLGAGPQWDYGTSRSAWSKICQDESWLDILIPQANLKPLGSTCNTVGWYLANDIQFTLITPFIGALFAFKPRLAHFVTAGSIAAILANYIRFFLPFGAGARNVFQWDLLTFTAGFHEMSPGYVRPQYRVVSYLIGLSAGHVLYEHGKDKGSKWPGPLLLLGKVYLLLSIYSLTFLPFISSLISPLDNENLVKILAILLLGFMHFAASLSTAIFILLVCTNNLSGRIVAFCSWQGFKPLAKACLPIVLIQIPLILYRTQTVSILPELSNYYLLTTFVIWSMETCLLSIVVHILYEVPLKRILVKLLLSSFMRQDPVQKPPVLYGLVTKGKPENA